MAARRWRIALYSGAATGLGHMRRNLLIGQTIASSRLRADILMVAESRQAGAFAMPPHMDCLTLPALHRRQDGRLEARYLDTPLQEILTLRADVILSALRAYDPDVLIVDFFPRGRLGELEPTLKYLRAQGRTRLVLGLRDVLDAAESPHSIASHGANGAGTCEYYAAIRDYYDALWIFADSAVHDLAHEYHSPPDIAGKMCYTGYLDQVTRLKFADTACSLTPENLALPRGALVLCLLGGGSDGGHLAETFIRADLPPHTNGVLLTGPQMPQGVQQRLRRHVANHDRLRVLEFVSEPALFLKEADRVIAMGGYNTICEVLSFEKPALIVPRVKPPEQLIRTERLRGLGLLDVLHPDKLNPRVLSDWLAQDRSPLTGTRDRINLNGLPCLLHLLEQLLNGSGSPRRGLLHTKGKRYVERRA